LTAKARLFDGRLGEKDEAHNDGLTPRIGTEIEADLETLLNGSAVAEFRLPPR
jgi:hypothetical protein